MREFEEALKRARAGVADPLEVPQGSVPDQGPVEPPVRQGAGIGTGQSANATQPAYRPAPSAPAPRPVRTPTPAVSLATYPPLTANIAFFRENFGSHSGDSAVVDGAFRILRTRVLEQMKQRGGQILGITSPAAGAGKTVTAIHLALACARRAEQAVVLADFDYRRPAVAQYLDATGFKPSIDYFRGQGQATDYLYRNEAGNLLFMLTDRSTEMSAEHLASSKFSVALDQLRAVSDNALVILDLPPMTGCDDALAVLPQLDGVLLVVAAGESKFSDLEDTVVQLPKDKLIGTVLNKAPKASGGYDYY